jgi:diadenosine tetraphosphate (Ap4A) HIT family hydrolase
VKKSAGLEVRGENMSEKIECLGCTLAKNHPLVNMVYEDEFVSCILDHDPFNEGHTLILPKKHILEVDDLDSATANSIMNASMLLSKAIKALYNPDGVTICQNGGVFNDELTHYHMHVVPRYKHQPFAEFFSEDPLNNQKEKSRLSETRAELIEIINNIIIKGIL